MSGYAKYWLANCSICGEVKIYQRSKPKRCKAKIQIGPRSVRLCGGNLTGQSWHNEIISDGGVIDGTNRTTSGAENAVLEDQLNMARSGRMPFPVNDDDLEIGEAMP